MFQNIRSKISSKLNLSPTKKKVAKNVYWAFLGKIVNMAAALFVGIIVARYLGPSQYGLMNYVISYVAIFEVISEFGLSNIEIRELSHHPDKKERKTAHGCPSPFFSSLPYGCHGPAGRFP